MLTCTVRHDDKIRKTREPSSKHGDDRVALTDTSTDSRQKQETHPCWRWEPVSMLRQPAPPPKPYPLGPYLRAWQFLQNSSASCSVQLVESNILPHIPAAHTLTSTGGGDNRSSFYLPHLKQDLCHL
jgi:hypothetical protein